MAGQNSFFFIPKENITAIPTASNNIISNNITATTDWYAGKIIPQTDDFTYKTDRTVHGVRYTVVLKGKIPLHSPEVESLFTEKSNREFVLLVVNNNKLARLCGNAVNGMRFTFEVTADGYNFEYSGQFSQPQPYYSGTYTVDGTVVGNTYTPAGNYIRAAKWINGSGVPSSSTGLDYDYYIDTQTTNYYQKVAGTWVYIGQLVDQELQELAYITAALKLTGNL